jgi:hypothetical protein
MIISSLKSVKYRQHYPLQKPYLHNNKTHQENHGHMTFFTASDQKQRGNPL